MNQMTEQPMNAKEAFGLGYVVAMEHIHDIIDVLYDNNMHPSEIILEVLKIIENERRD